MLNFIPPLIYLIAIFIVYKQVRTIYSLSVFIWALHLLSMLSFWIKSDFFTGFENDYSFQGLMVMFWTLVLITFPIVQFEKKLKKVEGIKGVSERKLKIVLWGLIGISMYAFVFFALNIPKVFALDIQDVRYGQIIFYESTIFSKIAVLGAFCSVYCIYIYFYCAATNSFPKARKYLLLSSTSFIIYTLNVAGRDGIVIWLLSYIAGYFFFHRYLPVKQIKVTKSVLGAVLIITLPVLIFITSSRFSDSSDKSSGFDSVLSYAGQALPNMSYAIDLTNKIHRRSGDGIFPIALIREITVGNENRFVQMEEDALYGFRSNQFPSYVGFFYPSYPFYVLLIFVILFNIVVVTSGKISRQKFDSVSFLPAYTWSMIPIVGIFYFYYGELIGNVFLILPFFIKMYLNK